jgi:peptide chain release factor 1
VAVLEEPTQAQVHLDPRDVEIKTCRGSGAGGQHRNTTDSAVQATHKPTGISVRCEGERSQHQNREAAMQLLRARILEGRSNEKKNARDRNRRKQVGSGMRADHRTGKQMSAKKYLRGDFDGLGLIPLD